MRVLTLDTALALEHGTPRQRLSAAVQATVEQDPRIYAATHVTIDLDSSERDSRLQRLKGDRYFSISQRGNCNQFGEDPIRIHEGYASPRLLLRLAEELKHHRPDLLIVSDPRLAVLLPNWVSKRCSVQILDHHSAKWHALTSGQLATVKGVKRHMHQAVLTENGLRRFGQPALQHAVLKPVLQFARKPEFFSKSQSIMVLATRNEELDRHILNKLGEAIAQMSARTLLHPEIMLMGFSPYVLAQSYAGIGGAMTFDNWSHLPGLAGSARAIFIPWLPPELELVARAVLMLGTPVVTTASQARHCGLFGQEGIVAASEAALVDVFATLLDPDLVAEADWRLIAKSAERLNTLAATGCAEPGSAQSGVPQPRQRRQRHIPPMTQKPQVLYNSLSQMLLVRLSYRQGTGIDHVRLVDLEGQELLRLMHKKNGTWRDTISLEGGLVIALSELGPGVTIELHDVKGVVQSSFVPVSDFISLQAELAWIRQEGSQWRGAFWVRNDVSAKPNARWALASADRTIDLENCETIDLSEVGGKAVRFSACTEMILRKPLHLLKLNSSRLNRLFASKPIALEQRPLVPTSLIAGKTAPTALPSSRIGGLKNLHAGKRAWIIGNGPSVRIEDLARIPSDDVIFCFNRFYLSYAANPLRETYVVSADTLMIKDFGQEMIDKSAGLPLFCCNPSNVADLIGEFVLLKPLDNYLPLFSLDPEAWVAIGGSSVYVALQMAHYMGLRDIVLYGLDYSFSYKLRNDPRFDFPISDDDGNHFISSYRSAKPWCPPTWRDISAGFLNARVAFETTGGTVRNATRGGKLEIYPRIDFDQLVKWDGKINETSSDDTRTHGQPTSSQKKFRAAQWCAADHPRH